jgi:hypothetical protein
MSNTTYSPSFKPATAPSADPLVEMFKATPLYIFISALKAIQQGAKR